MDSAHKHAVTHLGGVQKYWYDANGNMIKRIVGATTYNLTYDQENRLTEVSGGTTANFAYDGDGKRVHSSNAYQNLAGGAPATSDAALFHPDVAVNGDTWADSGTGSNREFAYCTSGLHYLQVDLGAVYSVDKVRVWHYADWRTYHNTKTEVSQDGVTWTTVFDSAVSGEYVETAAGKTHTFTARNVRYVRDWLNGSTANSGNHWVEIEVWGVANNAYVGDYFEWNGSTNTMTRYYYAGGQRVAVRRGSTLSFLLGEYLGSTAYTADPVLGRRWTSLRYKAWGEQRYAEGVAPTDFRYTGQRFESLLGLHDYGARWYDSLLGRWLQPDTIVPLESQGVQAWDRYAYANNNPVRYTDPTGHCIGPLLAVCIAAATFIADNAAAITAVALTGAIMSFVGPSNPDPQLINDPVASQQALENSAFQALGWLTLGQASLEFASIASPSVPILPNRTNPKDKTTGVLIAGGEQTTLISGRNGPASQMPPGASGYDIVSRTHVEGHASALMTQNEWTTGILWQNNIPCTSCTTNLPRMLPTNTTLRIIVPGEYDRIFKGR